MNKRRLRKQLLILINWQSKKFQKYIKILKNIENSMSVKNDYIHSSILTGTNMVVKVHFN